MPSHNWLNGSDQPTAVPPADAPQTLGELQERAGDAISFALGRDRNLPAFSFRSSGKNSDTQIFAAKKLFSLPDSISVVRGQVRDDVISLHLGGARGRDASCFFSRDNGGQYSFDYCTPQAYESICAANQLSHRACRAFKNLGLSAGHTVMAKSVSLQMDAASNNAQAEVTLANFNEVCGGIAFSSVYLTEDVTCSGAGNVGFQMVGDGNVLNGNGHSIVMPNASIGLFVMGANVTVRNVNVSGVLGGYGFMAYDANRLTVSNNQFSGNLVGMNVYTDVANQSGLQVLNNDVSGNAFAGLIVSGGDGFQTDNPAISGNSFANTGGYAIYVNAKNASFSDSQHNDFTGAKSALYLAQGNFNVTRLDLSKSGATGPQIFVEQAQNLNVNNVVLSYSAPGNSNQERVALHLYRVAAASINSLTVNAADVALKVATEQGTQTTVNVNNSKLNNNVVAGVMLQSYDDTVLGHVNIQNNDLSLNPAGYAVWLVGSTALASGSNIGNNTL